MRIADAVPDPPPGYKVISECTFCDEFCDEFLILLHGDMHCVMCIVCITQIVDAAADRFLVTADSQAGS